MPILLFDIDGTLVRTGGAGKAAMELALREEFQIRELDNSVPYSGRTDRAIGRDLLRTHGLDATDANQTRLVEGYLNRLPASLIALGGTVCPGIPEIIEACRDSVGVYLGLLTGNVKRGAATKLGHFGLWQHFAFGGFGDEFHDRDDVARSAMRNAEKHLGIPVKGEAIWVIGDTPLDVSCARAIGAKVIAVATGWHTLGELEACGPDVALADLGEVAAVLKWFGLV